MGASVSGAGAELAGFPVPSKKGGCRIGWFSRPLKEGRVQNWLVFPSPQRRAGAELAGFPVP
ncbi:polyribonucleotide nucleotidyltransferase [Arthrospira platensis C1]|nr:polyribonucleotide nucleotidyltransferase [Arthrospira platensis C1]